MLQNTFHSEATPTPSAHAEIWLKEIICFLQHVGGMSCLCRYREMRGSFNVKRRLSVLLADDSNSSALCQVSPECCERSPASRVGGCCWMNVKCTWGEKKPTVNGHFLLFWSSWWSHDSSTVQCTCSCVVFIVEIVNLQFFAMHCWSFCIVCVCVSSQVYFLIQSSGNWQFYLFFTRSFSEAYEVTDLVKMQS